MIVAQSHQSKLSLAVRAEMKLPRFQAWKKAALVGISCLTATQPLVAYAQTISGSADAPEPSQAPDGEDKQPPNFKYTHMW